MQWGGHSSWDSNAKRKQSGRKRSGRGHNDGHGDGGDGADGGPEDAGVPMEVEEEPLTRDHPVEYEPKDPVEDVWMAEAPGKGWIECDPTWKAAIDAALKDGTLKLRLPHVYRNTWGEEVTSWYTIDLKDIDAVSQTNEASGTVREMALFRRMKLKAVPPPPGAPPGFQPPAAVPAESPGQ